MDNVISPPSNEARTLDEIIWNCLERAIGRFNSSVDRTTLLCPLDPYSEPQTLGWSAANEPAISHRLAFYLECEFRTAKIISDRSPISVDCEYDRHLHVRKRLEVEKEYWKIIEKADRTLKAHPERKDLADFGVYPDIIVHERQFDRRNLLVLEVKKRTTALVQNWQQDYDDLKLMLFTRPKPRGYGYRVGAWVVVEDNTIAAKRCLHIEEKYSGIDKKT